MDDETDEPPEEDPAKTAFMKTVGAKASRKLRAKRRAGWSAWRGLGMIGTIGWSVTIPTLLGVMAGRWLDGGNPGGRSWTLALLAAGLTVGCLNAWHWVGKESKAGRELEEDGK